MNRLQTLVDYFAGGNVSKFEEEIGVKKTRVDKIIKRDSRISLDIVHAVKSRYKGVNENWIETGEGEMLCNETPILQVSGELHKAPEGRFPKRTNGNELIKFYDTDFAMGQIDFIDDVNSIKPAYVMDIPEFAGCTAFRGYSESMMPLITPGAILFGMRIEEWRSHLEPGQVYGIVMTDKRRYLKYIRRSVKPLTHYLLKSENPDFDDFEIPMKDIKSIWLIYGWMNKRV